MNIEPRTRRKELYIRTLFDTESEKIDAMNLFKNIANKTGMQMQNGKILIAALESYYKQITGGKR